MKRVIAALCLLLAVCLSFSACAPSVVTVGEIGVADAHYRYWLSCYKYAFLASYRLEDTEDTWSKTAENGKSYRALAMESIEQQIALRLAAVQIMKERGYRLPDSYRQAVAAAVDEWFSYYDGEETDRNAAFGTYGTDEAGAITIGIHEMEYRYLYESLFGDNGEKLLSDAATYQTYRERINDYYKNSCRRVQIMYVSDAKDILRMDEEVASGLLSEKGFLDCVERYACTDEDTEYIDLSEYPDGIWLSEDMPSYATGFASFPEVLELIFEDDFEINTCRSVEGNGGKYYVYRARLKDNAYLSETYKALRATFATVCADAIYLDLLTEAGKTMTKTEHYPDYDIAAIPANGDFNILKMLGY